MGLSPDDSLPEVGLSSPAYSYTKTTFQRLWAESPKRIERLIADAEVSPSDHPRFADVKLTLAFQGVTLPPNDPLYMDCIGVVPPLKPEVFPPPEPEEGQERVDMRWFHEREGSVLTCVCPRLPPGRGTVTVTPKVQAKLGRHVIGYELENIDIDQEVRLVIKGERGARADELDAIGVPVYGDAPVRSLTLSVTFKNLRPDPEPKDAQVYLLRRTLVDSRPANLAGGLKVKLRKSSQQFSWENLMMPRVGFGYCIAWSSLVKL